MRSLAQRVRLLRTESQTLERELERRVQTLAPQLLARPGIGPISAAAVLIAWSQPRRIRSEAAFARLAGAAPIPASSGKTIRYRLDRGGDRQLNRALHTIILSRRRTDNETKAYIARRLGEGKTQREATRCLKRYLARSLYEHSRRCPPLDSYRSIRALAGAHERVDHARPIRRKSASFSADKREGPRLRLRGPSREARRSCEGFGSSALRPSRASCPSPDHPVRPLQT